MNPSKRLAIIPYRLFEEYVTSDYVFHGFVWHGGESFSVVLPEVEVVADVKVDRGQKSIYRVSPSIRYRMMAVPATAIPQDVIKMHMPRIPSLDDLIDRQFYKNVPDAIEGTSGNPVQNATHLVKKGETIETLSKMYGVTIKNLKDINSPELPIVGKYYNVFPEINFTSNPLGGYQNPKSEVGIIYDLPSLIESLRGFKIAARKNLNPDIRNMVIRGNALEQLRNWDEVQILVKQAKDSLNKIGAIPGDAIVIPKQMTPLFGLNPFKTYTAESFWNKTKAAFGYPNEARDFWSPVHIIGSFSLSMRVNASGQTATVAVYDSKSVSSLSDNKLSPSLSTKIGETIETTYQRYVWTIRLK